MTALFELGQQIRKARQLPIHLTIASQSADRVVGHHSVQVLFATIV